jgi:putative ABC transport system permease protein
MEALLQDVRYALVTMKRNKGFTTAGLLTLALGIGATTAVFSVVYGVLIRPLPYPEPDRLVRLSEEHPGATSPLQQPMLSNLTYHAWRDSRTLEQFAAYRFQQYTIGLPGNPVRLAGAAVTPSLFALVGETPARGRFFVDAEAREGANAVAVLSDRGWRQHFNADPGVVGRGLLVDGKPHQIVGVARPGFYFPDRDALMWTPLEVLLPSPDAVAGQRGRMTVLFALARLRPGATPLQADAEGTAATRTTIRPMAANLLFGVGGPPVAHVRGLVREMTARIRPALLVLAAGVVFVLLIACANVANLFLSRGVARQRELTVRAAIGASRDRLARQLLTESLVLSSLGGALGLALAWTLVRAAPLLAARDFPRLDAIEVDARAIGFAALAALLTAIVSGLGPALRGSRFNLAGSLHGGDGASGGGFRDRRARRLRDGLLVAEAAFAVLLLVGATLVARSFIKLAHVDAGYTPENVLAAEIYVPGGDAADQGEAMNATVHALVERVRTVPGVVAAGASNMMPLDRMTQLAAFPSPWAPPGAEPKTARSFQYSVTPGYAEALGLRLKKGRLFTDGDWASGVREMIVNEEFARQYLPADPIGFQWRVPASADAPERINEIVGVVANTLKNGNDTAVQPEHYGVPQLPGRFYGRFEVVARTSADPSSIAPAVRAIVRGVAPAAAVETVVLAQRVAESMDEPRFAMTVLTAFATLALALAAVGLYGVLSYGVTQRRRELGLRAALGASRAMLVRQVIREGLGVTAIGLVAGVILAALSTRLMQSVLFGIEPLDPVSFTVAPVVLLLVAGVACLVPAMRAASTDPAEALRCE